MKFFESIYQNLKLNIPSKNNEIENIIECYKDNFFVENKRILLNGKLFLFIYRNFN